MIDQNFSKARLLIVDDEPKNLQLLGNILRERNYDIEFADNGHKALEWLKDDDFDLILLDIMMPGMDGFEVCSILQKDYCKIPIIFITAKTDEESIVKAFELGAVDYVTKPFRSVELLARIKNHLMIQKQKKQLKELNANKDRLFSIIAHDLKSPFIALFGMLDLMQYGLLDKGEGKILLENLQKAGREVYRLLENLLEWANFQRRKVSFMPVQISLNDITQMCVNLLEETAKQKEVQLIVEMENNLQAYADKHMISTVIRNLINNAVKFSHTGGQIKISGHNNENSVEIAIKDNGVGIAPEIQKKLFLQNNFHKTLGTQGEKGSGLGLVLCREFIEKNSGIIWVESEENKGSTFKFSLPVRVES